MAEKSNDSSLLAKQMQVNKSPISRATKTGLLQPNDNVHIIDSVEGVKSCDYSSVGRNYSRQFRAKNAFNKISGKTNITQELKQLGYCVLEEIGTKDSQGNEMRIKYLKVCNQMGQTAFIEIGPEDGIVAVNTKTLATVEMNQVSVIPSSVKDGSFRHAGHDTIGVAFICENNICVLTRLEDTDDHQEKNFVYVENYSERRGILGDNPIAYPVVRLAEVRANPCLVTRNINDATRRIRIAAREDIDQAIQRLRAESTKLYNQIQTFYANASNKYLATTNTLTQLEAFQNHNLTCTPSTELEKEKMDRCQHNLTSRNNLLVNILRCCSAVCEEECKIKASLERIQAINQFIENQYCQANGIVVQKVDKESVLTEVRTGGQV
jgi:hypothetical protein